MFHLHHLAIKITLNFNLNFIKITLNFIFYLISFYFIFVSNYYYTFHYHNHHQRKFHLHHHKLIFKIYNFIMVCFLDFFLYFKIKTKSHLKTFHQLNGKNQVYSNFLILHIEQIKLILIVFLMVIHF